MGQIIKCGIDNLDSLIQISIQTYRETYMEDNGRTVFEAHIKQSFSSNRLLQELENPNSLFFFLRSPAMILGYFKINWGAAKTLNKGDLGLEIERIYLLRSAQQKGYGTQMINHIVNIAQAKHLKSICLGVWQKNPKAIQFYKKMGFKISGTHTFMLDSEAQEDYIMKRELNVKET